MTYLPRVVSHVAQPLVVEPQTSECSPGMPLHQKCCVELSGHVTVLFSSTSQRHVTLRTAGVALLAAAVPGMTSSTGVLSGAGVGANVAVGAAEIDGADVGAGVGATVGATVGPGVGTALGGGETVGAAVGAAVVGASVGAGVTSWRRRRAALRRRRAVASAEPAPASPRPKRIVSDDAAEPFLSPPCGLAENCDSSVVKSTSAERLSAADVFRPSDGPSSAAVVEPSDMETTWFALEYTSLETPTAASFAMIVSSWALARLSATPRSTVDAAATSAAAAAASSSYEYEYKDVWLPARRRRRRAQRAAVRRRRVPLPVDAASSGVSKSALPSMLDTAPAAASAVDDSPLPRPTSPADAERPLTMSRASKAELSSSARGSAMGPPTATVVCSIASGSAFMSSVAALASEPTMPPSRLGSSSAPCRRRRDGSPTAATAALDVAATAEHTADRSAAANALSRSSFVRFASASASRTFSMTTTDVSPWPLAPTWSTTTTRRVTLPRAASSSSLSRRRRARRRSRPPRPPPRPLVATGTERRTSASFGSAVGVRRTESSVS